MADLDTRDKRASGIMPGMPFRGILPLADGTVDQPDRQFVPFSYSGITASSAGSLTLSQADINAIAAAVWDSLIASHTTAGTFGANTTAAAVWDKLTADHVVSGSFGEKVGKKLLTLAKWIGLR